MIATIKSHGSYLILEWDEHIMAKVIQAHVMKRKLPETNLTFDPKKQRIILSNTRESLGISKEAFNLLSSALRTDRHRAESYIAFYANRIELDQLKNMVFSTDAIRLPSTGLLTNYVQVDNKINPAAIEAISKIN